MSAYYQPSHKMTATGSLLLLAGGVAAAAVLAPLYIYAVWYIPSVYLNLLVCGVFGMLLGGALASLAKIGKLRSPWVVGQLALVVGLVAVYLEWSVFLTLLYNSKTTGSGSQTDTSTSFSLVLFTQIVTSPVAMWQAIERVNATGTWSLGSASATNTAESGVFLWLVWLGEAAIIMGVAYWLAHRQASEPFSETSDEWAATEHLARPLNYVQDVPGIRAALESGHFEQLVPYDGQSATGSFARLQLHHAPNASDCHYLTLQNVATKRDKKGKGTQQAKTVLKYLALSPATYQQLRQRFGTAV